MRTAEEIIAKEWDCKERDLQIDIILNADVKKIVAAINEARKEAIEECASIGEKNNTYYGYYSDGAKKYLADKQSILSLISELK